MSAFNSMTQTKEYQLLHVWDVLT